MLDGTGTAEQYAKRAAEMGQSALAITDHGTMAGVLHHIVECEKVGIKPIVGMESYWRWNRQIPMTKGEKRYHLVLLAKNQIGFDNLMRMSSEAYRSGMNGAGGVKRPCVDWELLMKYHEGIVASTACLSSPLSKLIMAGSSQADTWLKKLVRIFGEDVFIEIMPGDSIAQRKLNRELVSVADRYSIPLIATVDAHYPYPEWTETQDVLLMINTGQSHLLRKRKRDSGEDVYSMRDALELYLMSGDQVLEAFAKHHPKISESKVREAVKNTVDLSSRFESDIGVTKKNKLPRVPIDDVASVVKKWCLDGLRRIGKYDDLAYRERLQFEFGVLRTNEVIDYFYIIGDMCRAMRERGIRIGAGRGSAAGCLVSYLVGITSVDPIAHGLLFERFLNPGRKTLPDIDIDFQHDRRHEVIEYLRDKWGADRVVGVAAYQHFGAKAAISEVARVYDVPFDQVKKLTKKLTDHGKLVDLRKLIKPLDAFAEQHPEVWEHAIRLEGQARTLSRHPAGVVVTDGPVENFIPLCLAKDGEIISAWSEGEDLRIITDYGFLKIDVLATDSLTVQSRTAELVKQRHGVEIDFNLPVTRDPDADISELLDPFSRGLTLGIFQFGSRPLTQLLRKIKPKRFADLAAANALIRPGPLQGGMADSYAKRSNDQEKVEYWDDCLIGPLGNTFGLMTYQEQLMEVVKLLGGFSLAEADDMRRATAKKDASKMAGMRTAFIDGSQRVGLVTQAQAEDIWDKIVNFSSYSFNLSHAVGYAIQAVQDMWLKVHYPLEFYAAFATFEPDQFPAAVREAQAFDVNFLLPHIDKSEGEFVIEEDAIRFGLGAVKYVGGNAVQEIVAHRPFTSIDDFNQKVSSRKCNSRVRESLIACGAFDHLGGRDDWTEEAKAEAEAELLGMTMSGLTYVAKHRDVIAKRVNDIKLEEAQDQEFVMVGGEVIAIKKILTKKGAAMAFVDLFFEGSTYSVTVFPGEWAGYEKMLTVGNVVLIYGKKDSDRDVVIAEQVMPLTDVVNLMDEWTVEWD